MKAGATYLITGGGGSIGSALVKTLLRDHNPRSVRVFDNSDYLLAKLARDVKDERIRCLLGNIQDFHRLEMATKGVDYVFHLAAIKDISVTEYNPIETIKTNVDGTVNLIECCLRSRPRLFLNVSSDKAVGFSTLYGATKFITEKVTQWAHQVAGPDITFSCIRMGNVIETRGNVFEIWHEQQLRGEPLTLTSPDMQRYLMHIEEAVHYILRAAELAKGGEVFVPIMEEYNMADLAKSRSDDIQIIGVRCGEKLREELLLEDERNKALEVEGFWVIR